MKINRKKLIGIILVVISAIIFYLLFKVKVFHGNENIYALFIALICAIVGILMVLFTNNKYDSDEAQYRKMYEKFDKMKKVRKEMEAESNSDTFKCKSCGRAIEKYSKFCNHCGKEQ